MVTAGGDKPESTRPGNPWARTLAARLIMYGQPDANTMTLSTPTPVDAVSNLTSFEIGSR
jgi:hypothetical protein